MQEEEEVLQEIILPEDVDSESKDRSNTKPKSDNMLNDVRTSINNAWKTILDNHNKGHLPLQLLVVVVIYNFIFFQAEEGKEIYVFIPLVAAVICYAFKYWEFPRKIKYYLSGSALFIGLFWDLIVSISFIPTYTNWGWSYDSGPTLAVDMFALFSAIVWFTNEKKMIIDDVEKQILVASN